MGEYYIGKLPISSDELYHYGIPNMKHGVRRFQDKDGHLTPAGRIRYGVGQAISNIGPSVSNLVSRNGVSNRLSDAENNRRISRSYQTVGRNSNRELRERNDRAAGWQERDRQRMASAAANRVAAGRNAVDAQTRYGTKVDINSAYYQYPPFTSNRATEYPYLQRAENEARVNMVNANRNAAQARRDYDASVKNAVLSGKIKRNEENAARVNTVNNNRNMALARKEYDDARAAYENHPITRIENAANAVGNWVGNAANNVQNWAGNAYNNAQNWVGNAANNVQNAVNNAVDNAGNWVNNAANDAQNWAGNAANDVQDWATNAYNDAQNWAGNAANDVQDWATNAYEDASKWVGNAANDAKNFAANTAKDIGDWGSEQLNKGKALFRRIFG